MFVVIIANASSFFREGFWQNFVANFAATLVAAPIAVLLALLADRRLAAEGERKQRTAAAEREAAQRHQVLVALKEATEKNLTLVKQMEEQVKPEAVIFYNVDLAIYDAFAGSKFQLLDDVDLLKAVESLRYELGHLHRKVELQLETVYGPARAMMGFSKDREGLVGAIRAQFPRIKEEGQSVLSKLEAALQMPSKWAGCG